MGARSCRDVEEVGWRHGCTVCVTLAHSARDMGSHGNLCFGGDMGARCASAPLLLRGDMG